MAPARVKAPEFPSMTKAPRVTYAPKYTYEYNKETDLADIIQSVINGLDPAQIDPEYFGKLYHEIREKHKELVKAENHSAARAAQNCLCHISKHVAKEKQRLEQERLKILQREEYEEMMRRKAEEKRLRMVPQDVLDKCVALCLEDRFREIDPHTYKKLERELRRLQALSISQQDYKSAGRYDQAARRVSMLTADNRYEEITTSMASDWEEKVETARKSLQRTRGEWTAKIDEACEKRDNDIQTMLEERKRAMAEFDLKFDGSTPASYKKYSPKLIELRDQEKSLMKLKKFKEAKYIHEQAEELTRKEDLMFRQRFEEDLLAKRAEYLKKIDDKIHARETKTEEELFVLRRQGRREIERAQMALKRIEMHWDQAEALASICPQQTGPRVQTAATSVRLSRDRESQALPVRTRSIKTARSCQIRKPLMPDKSPQEVFRQRRAINNIVYSKMTL